MWDYYFFCIVYNIFILKKEEEKLLSTGKPSYMYMDTDTYGYMVKEWTGFSFDLHNKFHVF